MGLASSRRRRGSGEGESPLSASHARRMGSALGSEQAGAGARAPPAEARRMGKRRAPLAGGTLRARCGASYSYTSSCSAPQVHSASNSPGEMLDKQVLPSGEADGVTWTNKRCHAVPKSS